MHSLHPIHNNQSYYHHFSVHQLYSLSFEQHNTHHLSVTEQKQIVKIETYLGTQNRNELLE